MLNILKMLSPYHSKNQPHHLYYLCIYLSMNPNKVSIYMKKIFVVTFVIFVASCASVKVLVPTQADADRGAKKYPGYTLVDLNQGKALCEQHCTACHGLKKPGSKTAEEWKEIVPEMTEKANEDGGSTAIDAKTEDLILKYLVTMGKPE